MSLIGVVAAAALLDNYLMALSIFVLLNLAPTLADTGASSDLLPNDGDASGSPTSQRGSLFMDMTPPLVHCERRQETCFEREHCELRFARSRNGIHSTRSSRKLLKTKFEILKLVMLFHSYKIML